MKKPRKKANQQESTQAYEQAQRWLKDWEEGYIRYDKVFTSSKEAVKAFGTLVSGAILEFGGNNFFWKRQSGEPLILYAQNIEDDKLKDRGLVELCRIRVPDIWVGAGRYQIDWPKGKEKTEDPLLLVSLYLYSTDPSIFNKLIVPNSLRGAYMVSLFFDNENSGLFFELAEQRFESLK